jgi:peptidoglycan/xylan/chitin deacetylase (PgdA/CDA1 family)
MSHVTIVMYHYVRDLQRSRYPEIKALGVDQFQEQVGYLKRHYTLISGFDLMDAVESGAELPPRAALLTFDDGYIDHFTEVLPVLRREKLPGCFFPPAECVAQHRILDVNKIHFVLASVADKGALVDYILRAMNEARSAHGLESNAFYWEKRGIASRFDTAEVMFVKYMLQRDLPQALRKNIVDGLFEKFVSEDEAEFSTELYMGMDQIADLQRNGMYVGSHGFEHIHLDSASPDAQQLEIDLSIKFLREVGADTTRWIIAYPYGAYNQALLDILRQRGCTVGLTTKVAVADLHQDNPLTLPRLDTNDLPKDSKADFVP